jgi:hypothetical protein
MDRYRYRILSEATGGPDDIYHGGVFARHTDGKEATDKYKDSSGSPAIVDRYSTRANDTHIKYAQIPYGGDMISHDVLRNNESSDDSSAND